MVMKGCCNSSEAVARLSTDSSRHRSRKSRKIAESRSRSLISGLPIVAIRYSAYKEVKTILSLQTTYIMDILNFSRLKHTRRGFSVRYGGSPSTISMARIPRDQMSTL